MNATTKIQDTSNQDEHVSSRPRHIKNVVLLGALAVAIAISFYLYASQPSAGRSYNRDSLQLAQLERGDLVRDIVSSGKIIASNAPQLYSPEEGFVSLLVKAGDAVELNQVLAYVESPELENTLKQEQSELERLKSDLDRQKLDVRRQTLVLNRQADIAKVDLDAAVREEKRAQLSIKDHLISQIDLEKAIDDLARAQVNHKHAIAEVALATDTLAFELETAKQTVARQTLVVEDLQRKIANLQIRASVDGVVGNVLVQPKALVTKNAPLMTLVDLSAYEAELNVAESLADELGIGMTVELDLNTRQGATTVMGVLSSISPEVVGREVTARVRFDEQGISGIRQNQQITARIMLENKQNVLKVKRGSFMQAGGHLAYRVNGDIAERVDIRIGATSMREVEILAGLVEGDQIIISNYETFKNADALLLRN